MVKAIASLFTATIQLPLWLVLLTAGLLLMLAGRAYVLYRRNRLNVSKVRFLFDAIDNGDYTFHFSEDAKKDSDAALNSLLNRTKSVLQHARDEQKEREKYFELILDAVDTGILVVETQRGIVLRFNRAALQLLQRSDVSYISQVEKQLSDSTTSAENWPIRRPRAG